MMYVGSYSDRIVVANVRLRMVGMLCMVQTEALFVVADEFTWLVELRMVAIRTVEYGTP